LTRQSLFIIKREPFPIHFEAGILQWTELRGARERSLINKPFPEHLVLI
jgi:hypothetical protein